MQREAEKKRLRNEKKKIKERYLRTEESVIPQDLALFTNQKSHVACRQTILLKRREAIFNLDGSLSLHWCFKT